MHVHVELDVDARVGFAQVCWRQRLESSDEAPLDTVTSPLEDDAVPEVTVTDPEVDASCDCRNTSPEEER